MCRGFSSLPFVVVLACLPIAPLWGQTNIASGELYGVIVDPSGVPVAATIVALESLATGWKRQALSGGTGEYRFLLVPPGVYQVRAEKAAFRVSLTNGAEVIVGHATQLDLRLEIGEVRETMVINATTGMVDTERTNSASFLNDTLIHELPINRRDYLTFVLLAPGVTDAKAVVDNSDLRIKQTPSSGISFFGSNGRGNSVTVDGGEMNDGGGGVRSTIGQEAVEEFQINRGNYSAEIGAASGGAINIISKSGTNEVHGSAFLLARNDSLDAGDPFARVIQGSSIVRLKPPSNRQQFGASLGAPLRRNRTFLFVSFEGIVRRESSVVSILTDDSIFGPTAQQEAYLRTQPADRAASLRSVLTSPPSTVQLFRNNSGVFPYRTDGYKSSVRFDHTASDRDQLFFRADVNTIDESNANLQALVGASRGLESSQFDPTAILGWTHVSSPQLTNDLRVQANYRHFSMHTQEKFGPEIRIAGYGIFNRDIFLPSRNIERRYEIKDNAARVLGKHILKFGGEALIRGVLADNEVFFPGRFNFGDLPAAVIDPSLPANFNLTALQAFNLGLPQSFIIGQGASVVGAIYPYWGAYAQDSWRLSHNLTLDAGLRYEVDVRKAPLRTDKNNFAPRLSFAWNPDGARRLVIRGGYGVFYAPVNFAIDYTVNALNQINGYRQISQAFSSILVPGLASSLNIFRTLRAQGVIGIPTPARGITPQDLAQFGISFPHTGPLPPFTVLFEPSKDYASTYTQQSSLSLEREIGSNFSLELGGLFSRSLKLPRTRDANLLKAPIDPSLGIPVWSSPSFFTNPLLAHRNVSESTGLAWYSAFTAELKKRFTERFTLGGNYTFSRTIDDVVDYNFEAFDQTNLRKEHALSSFHQTHRVVAYGMWQLPFALESSWILRANSGRPFNLLAGYDLNQDRNDQTDRPAFAGRNTGTGPAYWAIDIRLARSFAVGERRKLDFTAEAFNLLNHLNFSSVNNIVGNMRGPYNVTARDDRLPSQPLGFTSAFESRKIQLGVRLSF